MIEIFLIGIGTGNPRHLTLEAITTLNELDLVLLPKKNKNKEDLYKVRKNICNSVIKNRKTKIEEYAVPQRSDNFDYFDSVNVWHEKISKNIYKIINKIINKIEIKNPKLGFLIWGDPGLYDSNIRIISHMNINFKLKIISGISSIQELTSAHLVSLNDIGESVLITTGRKLKDSMFVDYKKVFVMLDGKCSFKILNFEMFYIWWGAYLGMKNQILIKGLLKDVNKKIVSERARARKVNGWIMDSYLLKKIK